jgi:hypothetical protein
MDDASHEKGLRSATQNVAQTELKRQSEENGMAHQTTPHTQSQQNVPPDQSDFDPDQSAQSSELPSAELNPQIGSNRAPERLAGRAHRPNTEPAAAAMEGSVTTRTRASNTQGITNRSANEEAPGQRKVVQQREDAQAGVNHNR